MPSSTTIVASKLVSYGQQRVTKARKERSVVEWLSTRCSWLASFYGLGWCLGDPKRTLFGFHVGGRGGRLRGEEEKMSKKEGDVHGDGIYTAKRSCCV